ncbi:hypothetical protein [Methanogenium cariaci]|uniref:hypothetical protein n=1 Tax=Methanogenium cariaci TaxID=2197 RepID=UPI0012F656B4|nr:hypothetical protein [Methanogenium cariaci]
MSVEEEGMEADAKNAEDAEVFRDAEGGAEADEDAELNPERRMLLCTCGEGGDHSVEDE